MKKRIMSLLLAVLMLVGTFPAPIYAEETAAEESTLCSVCGSEVCTCEAEEASMDFSGDVLKYAEFIEASYSYSVTDGENLTADASVVLYYDEFEEGTMVRITDWYWDNETTALWYQVEFYSGGVVEEAAEFWPTDAWVLQDYTDEEYEFDCSLSFVATCATCGLPDCDGEHTLCPTCGAVDCNGVHLICLACGEVACTEDHVWCGYCGEFDCGTEHESTAPITVPVMPESYTLPEGESMVLVDEHGDAIGGEGLCLTEGTKTSVSAWSALDGSGASYRWQLCYDYANDLWVDIQGQTEKGMVVSAAMFRGIIDAVGTATLRCVAESGEETVISDAIPVYFAADVDEAALFSAGGASGSSSSGSEITDEDVTIHKIIIEYVYADDSKFSGQRVARPYIAEIADGKELSDTVISPNCVGYAPDQAQVTLAYDSVKAAETITVYYSPAEVSYTVRHYLQNVDDDEYTWIDTTMATGKTEALTSDAAAKSYTGFTALTHFHEEIAADSSTMIDIYYDRNYYLMSFNLDGGYGVDPIYARYGADISVGTPYKAGYIFAGWDKTIPSTMPAVDQSFTASWTTDPDGVSYTVAYWLEDANTSEYNFWGSFVVNGATADSTVQGETYKDYMAYLDSETLSNMDTYEKRYSYYSHADTDVTVKGDGSTVVNVYYKRNEYTLKFYYAASSGSGTNANYYVIGGSTYYFGANAEISDSNKGNEIKLIDQYMSSRKSERGQVDELPALNAIGNARTEYTLGSDTSTVNGTAYNYHYLSFKAKYGEDISALWPCGVFNSVTRMNTDSDTNNSWSGVEAFVSAWNGEHHVLYSLDSTINKDNQTIKGNYSELDYKILWKDTYGDPDDMTVSYLCFWENGADIGWSIPELYRYNIYVPVLTGQDTTGLTTTTYGGTTYYLWASYDTCDNSEVKEQTPPAINGYTYKVYTSEDLAPNRNESILYDTNGNQIYSEAYAVNFFYTRDTYTLIFNDGKNDVQKTTVHFGEDISGMAPTVTYHDSAVAEMYVFSGWYTSADALEDSRFELTGATMPASPLTLYAGWSLITHSVSVYLTAEYAENGSNPLISNLEVTHNEIVPQEYHPDPSTLSHPTDESATFIGWFYKDANGNEQAFDFAASTVTEDLIIYAKWRSNIMKQVVINYVVEDADGNQTAIAATETVMLRVGQTRTFEAKTGVSLYEEYRTGCFPTTASHSITPTDTSTEEQLTYTFVYKQYGTVPYQVEFYVVELDGTKRPAFMVTDGKAEFVTSDEYATWTTEAKNAFAASNTGIASGGTLTDGGQYIEQHWQNDKAVVTELYVPDDLADISWKLPDAYLPSALREQKIIVPSTTNPETNIEANTIEFIYTLTKAVDPDDPDNPDSDDPTSDVYKARYLVQHYIQNAAYLLAGDKPGMEEYTVYSYSDEEGLSTQTATASPISIPGYTYSYEVTEDKLYGATLGVGADGEKNTSDDILTGTITADDALELNFYYTVNSYAYQVMYLEEGSNRVLEPTKTTDSEGNKLTGYYSTKVTESAIEIEGYDVVGNSTASIYIQMEAGNTASVNTIVFYYALKNADLIISKTVALDEDQAKEEGVDELPESALTQEFEFTVYCPTGYNKSVYNYSLTTVTEDGEGNKTTTTTVDRVVTDNATTMTVKLRHGQTIQIHDLIMGTYIITETYVPGFRITVNGSSDAQQMENVSITAELVEANKDVQVDFTNSYPFFVGDLVLGKKVAKLDASDPDATEPYKVSVKFQPYSETREVDRVITFVDSDGNTITDVDGNSSFTVSKLTGTDDETEFTIDIMVPVDGTVTMKGVPAGTFTATEEVKGTVGYIADFYTVTYNKTTHKNEAAEGTNHEVSGVVHGGHATELDFTNTYKKGNLTINKVVTQEYANDNWESDTFTFTITGTTELPDGTYTVEGATVTVVNGVVTVKDEDGKDPTISITRTEGGDEWSGSLSFANLPAGYYTVTETAKLGNDKYTSILVCEPDTGLVNDTDTPAVFTFTNTYKQQSADLKITATCGDTSQTFMYVVTNVEKGISLTVAVPTGKTVTVKDVPVGDYNVSEYNYNSADWNWRYNNATAVVVEVRANVNNEAVFNYGAPTIVKWLNGYNYYYKKEGGDG